MWHFSSGRAPLTAHNYSEVPLPSLPSMVGRPKSMQGYPQWSALLQCNCVLRVPPPGVVIPSTCPKPASSHPHLWARLTALRALPLCMPWPSPESETSALQEMVAGPLLLPEECRGRILGFPFLSFPPLAWWPAVPKLSKKKRQFPLSLGPKLAT